MSGSSLDMPSSSASDQYGMEQPDSSKGISKAAFVCGLVACALNVILFTAPLGMIVGIVAFIFSCIALARHKQGRAGMVLSLVSFLILFIWALSVWIVIANDPTFGF